MRGSGAGVCAGVWFVGALIAFALPAYPQTEHTASPGPLAQSGEPAKVEKTESSVSLDTSAKLDPAPKAESSAPSASTVESFIARLDSATRAIHENSKNDPALIREGCRALLNEVLDLNAMTQATNVEIWQQMTPPQRDLLRAAFEHRMISSCVRQLALYEGENMRLAGVKSIAGGDMLATIRLGTRDDAKLVTWRLQHTKSDSLRAVDVITEGRSAVSDARNEFAAVLQSVNGDVEALIAFMQK